MENPDAKLASWIKLAGTLPIAEELRPKFDQAFDKLKSEIAGTPAGKWAEAAYAAFTCNPVEVLPESWRQVIEEINAMACPKTAVQVVKAAMPQLGKLTAEQIAHILPDATAVETWRKLAEVSTEALTEFYLADLEKTTFGVGGEWLMEEQKPQALLPLLGRLVDQLEGGSRTRLAGEMLCAYLVRDAKGVRLEALLTSAIERPAGVKALARLLRTSRPTRFAVYDALGFAGQSAVTGLPLAILVRDLFEDAAATSGQERRETCGEIARLGSALLLAKKLTDAGAAALQEVGEISSTLRNLARSPALISQTWVLESVERPIDQGSGYLTVEGARRWAFAYEEAIKAGQAVGLLEVLGFNLGLRKIAEIGQPLEFVPQFHEDIDGGVLPEDPVVAVTTGWQFNQKPIVRARVKKTP